MKYLRRTTPKKKPRSRSSSRSSSKSSSKSTSPKPKPKRGTRRRNVDIQQVNNLISKYEKIVREDEESAELKEQMDSDEIDVSDLEKAWNKHMKEDSQFLDLGSRGNPSEHAVKNLLILNYLQEMLDAETERQPDGQVEDFNLDHDGNPQGPDFNQRKANLVKSYKTKLSGLGVRGL